MSLQTIALFNLLEALILEPMTRTVLSRRQANYPLDSIHRSPAYLRWNIQQEALLRSCDFFWLIPYALLFSHPVLQCAHDVLSISLSSKRGSRQCISLIKNSFLMSILMAKESGRRAACRIVARADFGVSTVKRWWYPPKDWKQSKQCHGAHLE